MADKKAGMKGLDLLIGMGPPPKSGASGDDDPDVPGGMSDDDNMFDDESQGSPDELQVAQAEHIIDAFHQRDPEALASALQQFMQMM